MSVKESLNELSKKQEVEMNAQTAQSEILKRL